MKFNKTVENAEYYIWWLLNCSQGVNKKQINKDVTSLINKLNSIYLKTGDSFSEFDTLKEIQLFDYNVELYKSIKEFDKLMEEELEELMEAENDKYYYDLLNNHWRQEFE